MTEATGSGEIDFFLFPRSRAEMERRLIEGSLEDEAFRQRLSRTPRRP